MNIHHQYLGCAYSYIFQYSASLTQHHTDLYIVLYVKLEIYSKLASQFRYPTHYFDADLMRQLLEILLHHSLFHRFLSTLYRRFITYHSWVILPRPLN